MGKNLFIVKKERVRKKDLVTISEFFSVSLSSTVIGCLSDQQIQPTSRSATEGPEPNTLSTFPTPKSPGATDITIELINLQQNTFLDSSFSTFIKYHLFYFRVSDSKHTNRQRYKNATF